MSISHQPTVVELQRKGNLIIGHENKEESDKRDRKRFIAYAMMATNFNQFVMDTTRSESSILKEDLFSVGTNC